MKNDFEDTSDTGTSIPDSEHKSSWISRFQGGWILAVGLIFFLASGLGEILSKPVIESWVVDRPVRRLALEGLLLISKELGGVLIVGYLVQELIESRHRKTWQVHLENRVDNILKPAIRQVRLLNEDLGITLRNELIIEDEAARKELTKKVLRPDFIRRGYKLTLKLEPSDKEGVLRVTTTTEYILHNVGQHKKEYAITGWIDTARDRWLSGVEEGKFTYLTFGPEYLRSEDQHRPVDLDPERNKLVSLTRTTESLLLKYPIHPDIEPGGRYFIKLIAQQYMQNKDQFVWNMVHVTDGLTVSVMLGEGLNWDTFIVTPRLMHHTDEFQNPHPATIDRTREWILKNILLPYQGVQIWWSPKMEGP